jgi:tyrosine-protein kinase Etk/Wzc
MSKQDSQVSYADDSSPYSVSDTRANVLCSLPPMTPLTALLQLARHKRAVALVTGLSMLVGAVVAMTSTVLFTATTRIMTPQQTPSASVLLMSQAAGAMNSSLANSAAVGGFGLRNPNDLYIGLLGSRPIAEGIITQFALKSVYRTKELSTARAALAANTNFTSERSGLIAISVTDRDKARAAEIANSYTAKLRELTKHLALTEASQRRLFYEEQLRHAQDDLTASLVAFREIEKEKGLVHPDAQARAVIERGASIRAQIVAKQVQLEALRSFSTEMNPDVQIAENELRTLQQQARELQIGGGDGNPADPALQDLGRAGIDYVRTEHDVQYRQTLFDLLLKQFDAARLDESKNSAVIQVVEEAVPPERRSSPHRTFIVLVFAIVGFIVSCAWVIAREYLSRRDDVVGGLQECWGALRGK